MPRSDGESSARSVVVVGGGQGGLEAAVALRDRGFDGSITLVSQEGLPYQRPPLSKGFLEEKQAPESLALRSAEFLAHCGIELRADQATRLDLASRSLSLLSTPAVNFESVVLATGAEPRMLRCPGAQGPGVLAMRTVDDAVEVQRLWRSATRVVIVGGGFIGLEVAAAARKRGLDVTIIEALPRLLSRGVSEPIADFFRDLHLGHGCTILTNTLLAEIRRTPDGAVAGVLTADGLEIQCDVVVVGIGVEPRTTLAADAGLMTDSGVLVDRQLHASHPGTWAIGDCARFPSEFAPDLVRLESVQNAVDQARFVAEQITNPSSAGYAAVPWFWSYQHEVKLQIVGLVTGYDETIVSGAGTSDSRFTVMCFRNGELCGAESINSPGEHMAARKLLASRRGLTSEEAARPAFDLKTHALQSAIS